ncbi:methyltransferase domain-containing protein [Patescibacteria group bacterium]|nr:methyltransferase domain-containing protein [Patescibacteria group bacterium]
MEDKETQFLNPDEIIKQINLKPGDQVGDLGCGTGYMSFAGSRVVGEKGRIFAVDVQKYVLEQVKKEAQMENLANIQTIWSDLEMLGATDITEHSLDMVFLVNILFQVQNKQVVFTEAKRLLKQAGKILVVDWKPGNMSIGPNADKRVDLANIRQIAQASALSEEKEINAGKYHFGVLFKT